MNDIRREQQHQGINQWTDVILKTICIAPCDSRGVTPCASCGDPIHHRRQPELYVVSGAGAREAMLCIACALCIDEDTTMTLMHDRVGNDPFLSDYL